MINSLWRIKANPKLFAVMETASPLHPNHHLYWVPVACYTFAPDLCQDKGLQVTNVRHCWGIKVFNKPHSRYFRLNGWGKETEWEYTNTCSIGPKREARVTLRVLPSTCLRHILVMMEHVLNFTIRIQFFSFVNGWRWWKSPLAAKIQIGHFR